MYAGVAGVRLLFHVEQWLTGFLFHVEQRPDRSPVCGGSVDSCRTFRRLLCSSSTTPVPRLLFQESCSKNPVPRLSLHSCRST